MKASIICPTYNGGSMFRKCLASLLSQEVDFPYEIVIVDSSSTDGTAEYLAVQSDRHSNLQFHSIRKSEFGHGKTRNLAVSLSKGEYVAVVTQDAIPQNSSWLRTIVQDVERQPDAAGGFGRHVARPENGPIIAHEIDAHFEQFGEKSKAFSIEDKQRYETDESYRQFLHFFSDSNACLKREVWERIPYPEVDFCEDQLWAKTFLEAGFSKVYSPQAIVMHSHAFGFRETLMRSYQESKYFRQFFGYRLGNRWHTVLPRTIHSVLRDFQILHKNEPMSRAWKWWLTAASNNLAKHLGHYLGSKCRSLS